MSSIAVIFERADRERLVDAEVQQVDVVRSVLIELLDEERRTSKLHTFSVGARTSGMIREYGKPLWIAVVQPRTPMSYGNVYRPRQLQVVHRRLLPVRRGRVRCVSCGPTPIGSVESGLVDAPVADVADRSSFRQLVVDAGLDEEPAR